MRTDAIASLSMDELERNVEAHCPSCTQAKFRLRAFETRQPAVAAMGVGARLALRVLRRPSRAVGVAEASPQRHPPGHARRAPTGRAVRPRTAGSGGKVPRLMARGMCPRMP